MHVCRYWISSLCNDERHIRLKSLLTSSIGDFDAIIANSFFLRLRGLLFRTPLKEKECLVLYPCRSIHTFGMGYAIDILFLDMFGTVVDYQFNLSPSRLYIASVDSVAAVEMKSGFLCQSQNYLGVNFKYKN